MDDFTPTLRYETEGGQIGGACGGGGIVVVSVTANVAVKTWPVVSTGRVEIGERPFRFWLISMLQVSAAPRTN